MTNKSTEEETYTVRAIEKTPNAVVNLEEFLVRKLGSSAGRSLYKDLVSTVKDATKSYAGSPAIDLDTKRGVFVVLRAS